jgi:hypothetical protein
MKRLHRLVAASVCLLGAWAVIHGGETYVPLWAQGRRADSGQAPSGLGDPPPSPSPGKPASPAADREPVQLLWERALPGVRAVALSPEGERLAVLCGEVRDTGEQPLHRSVALVARSSRTTLQFYDRGGALRWEQPVAHCSRVLVGSGGRLLLTCQLHSALFPAVELRDGEGRLEARRAFADPVEAVALSESNRRVVVGTLAGDVIVLRRGAGSGGQWEVAWQRRAGRPVCQVLFGPNDSVLAAAGSPPTLARYRADGAAAWRGTPRLPDRPRFSTSADGQLIAVAGPIRLTGQSELQLWNASGEQLWHIPLAGRDPSIRLAGSGARLVVGYERLVPGANTSRFERVLACFDGAGQEQWHKGGAFFAPLLVTLENRGDWVLSLGRQSKFWLLGRGGETRWRYNSAAPVQLAVGSKSGARVGVYRTDGRLMLFEVGA